MIASIINDSGEIDNLEFCKLNEAINDTKDFEYDISIERRRGVLNIINKDIEQLIKLGQQYNRNVPLEIKII
ncbi:hypothetical protein [Alkalicoccobacillus porphyridii]|uniref:Uncharacterized protein n=1 Tax=Alkalicoccobacillus porphyridii TaxID=2597270 RepID=A0A554A4G0_9BACI|nr:hypothetical protein [Alkalicoccobacillus porphyridii]TSB48562.1 hypothetical protein FN960_03130 [Alkalicoccobacillus porphyridii]